MAHKRKVIHGKNRMTLHNLHQPHNLKRAHRKSGRA
jgi:hypothetical protein